MVLLFFEVVDEVEVTCARLELLFASAELQVIFVALEVVVVVVELDLEVSEIGLICPLEYPELFEYSLGCKNVLDEIIPIVLVIVFPFVSF